MNETSNRKVLISVKVSTLLLILVTIIAVIIIATVISNKLSNNSQVSKAGTTENLDSAKIEESEIDNVEETDNERQTMTERVIQANISSRSLEGGARTAEPVEETVVEPEIVTTPIEEVTISKDMDLTVRTGLSREDFITLMAGVKADTSGFFEENAGLIYDMCEKYQLNEIFFCGLISAESGWTIASNHRNTHNYISLMSGNGLIKFSSVESGIEKAAETLHNNYLTPGGRFYYGPTLAGMKTKFCPASSTWVNLVYQRMQQILK